MGAQFGYGGIAQRWKHHPGMGAGPGDGSSTQGWERDLGLGAQFGAGSVAQRQEDDPGDGSGTQGQSGATGWSCTPELGVVPGMER